MMQFLGVALLLGSTVLFTNCQNDDEDANSAKGKVRFEITDGPIDDANVKGSFVTIANVKVDGHEIEGFTKQTIDLMAYQHGSTKLLGDLELEAGNYSDVTLVLDYAADAAGNAPGCYVLSTDNMKHNLQASTSASNELNISTGNFEVTEDGTTNVVLDFDLRKSIRYEDAPQSGDGYDFVGDTELRSAIRLVAKAETGTVSGNCSDNLGFGGEKIVVYAYAKGNFDKNTEIKPQGESQLHFKNAVSSAVVNSQGDYTLAFLEEGNYELHFFSYTDNNDDGKLELGSELSLDLLTNLGLDLLNLTVEANATISISVLVTGKLP